MIRRAIEYIGDTVIFAISVSVGRILPFLSRAICCCLKTADHQDDEKMKYCDWSSVATKGKYFFDHPCLMLQNQYQSPNNDIVGPSPKLHRSLSDQKSALCYMPYYMILMIYGIYYDMIYMLYKVLHISLLDQSSVTLDGKLFILWPPKTD